MLKIEMDIDVFISYEFGSRAVALVLQQKLIESNMSVAIASDRKQSDFDFPLKQIHCDLIKSSKVVLCLLNKKYFDSRACHLELNYSIEICKQVLPVMVENVDVRIDSYDSEKIQVFKYGPNWTETPGFNEIKLKLLQYLSVKTLIQLIP